MRSTLPARLATSLLALSLAASTADASPPKTRGMIRGATRVAARVTPRRALPAPVPVVPVQIAGVRTGRGRTWAAFMHALNRDALPTLHVCHAALGGPRGMVHVEISHRENGRWVVAEVASARRDHMVELCVRRAAERVDVPPSDDPDADTEPVAFDVAFGVPALLPRR